MKQRHQIYLLILLIINLANCQENETTTTDPSETTTDQITTTTPSEITTTLDPEGLPICSKDGTYFLPHPTNCQLYIFCINNVRLIQSCQTYFKWDYKLEKCVSEDDVNCFNQNLKYF